MADGESATAPPVADPPHRRERGPLANLLKRFAFTLVIALGIAFGMQAFLVKPYEIPSESMMPTLEIGQRVLVNRLSGDPQRGDILVFKAPEGALDGAGCGVSAAVGLQKEPCPLARPGKSDDDFIKRVVGLPGERLAVEKGRVYINGELQKEPFIEPDEECALCDMPKEIVIPEGQYFMMGDNRGESADSREWGPIPKDYIVGKAFATYWPSSKWGGL